jgi:hypothetical protein
MWESDRSTLAASCCTGISQGSETKGDVKNAECDVEERVGAELGRRVRGTAGGDRSEADDESPTGVARNGVYVMGEESDVRSGKRCVSVGT